MVNTSQNSHHYKLKPIHLIYLLFLMILLILIAYVLPGMLGVGESSDKPISRTYYIDSINGDDNNSGLSAHDAWQSIQKVNAISSYNAGDQLLFHRGQIWREELQLNPNGTPEKKVVVGAYGTGKRPIISGADLIEHWEEKADSIYSAQLSTEPMQVFFSNERGTRVETLGHLDQANEWYWSNETLYVYGLQLQIEATVRPASIFLPWQEDQGSNAAIIVRDLILEKAINGLVVQVGGQGFVATELLIRDHYIRGLFVDFHHSMGYISDGKVSYSEFTNNGRSGITINRGAENWLVTHNIVEGNGTVSDHEFTGGIKFWSDDQYCRNHTIEYNRVARNGVGSQNVSSGMGIWVDECGDGNVTRCNIVYGNGSNGIYYEHSNSGLIENNYVYENGLGNLYTGGIVIGRGASYNRIYHNILVNNWSGLHLNGIEDEGITSLSHNKSMFNVIIGNQINVWANIGGNNDNLNGSDNVYIDNLVGIQADMVNWGYETLSDYEQWASAYGNPVFTDQFPLGNSLTDISIDRAFSLSAQLGIDIDCLGEVPSSF